jgi:hypothetical protein
MAKCLQRAREKEIAMTLTPPAERLSLPYVSTVPFEHERIGAAAVYCSDGRYGEQMDEFLHHGLGLPHYDRVAIPGGAACLAGHLLAMRERGALDRQLKFLVEGHGLERIVLIAHNDCGFYRHNVHPHKLRNVLLEELQAADLATVAAMLRDWNRMLEVDAYFARRVEGRVQFEPIAV